MYPRAQVRHRNREATVYPPALGGDGPRLGRRVRITLVQIRFSIWERKEAEHLLA
jgi:hypothetical protein